jgi:two-component system, OmpR family, sensor histidine kinase ChvG
MIMSAAVPVRRLGPALGVLHLSVSGKEIGEIMREDRRRLLNLFGLAVCASLIVSYLMARGIARPLRYLSIAARRYEMKSFTREVKREHILPLPDYSKRKDEIGSLSRSLKKMFRGLEARMSEAETFAAEVSHELKNPLTSLKSALDTSKKIDDPEKKALLENIMQHDIRRIDRLIGDISNLSRLDGEMMRETDERLNLTRLLKDLTGYYQTADTTNGVRIVTDFPEKDVFMFGLAERLGQVFRNLLDNAISFTPAGKAVTLTLDRNERHDLRVMIDDEGPGLPLDRVNQIFERFYSHRPGTTGFGNHSGLGLSIAKKITEAHDGKIHAENRKNEQGDILGARFTITFPAPDVKHG